jgi:hypothetical protein
MSLLSYCLKDLSVSKLQPCNIPLELVQLLNTVRGSWWAALRHAVSCDNVHWIMQLAETRAPLPTTYTERDGEEWLLWETRRHLLLWAIEDGRETLIAACLPPSSAYLSVALLDELLSRSLEASVTSALLKAAHRRALWANARLSSWLKNESTRLVLSLASAVDTGDRETILALHERAREEQIELDCLPSSYDPLLRAARNGDTETILLLQEGHSRLRWAHLWAACGRRTETVQWLYRRGVYPPDCPLPHCPDSVVVLHASVQEVLSYLTYRYQGRELRYSSAYYAMLLTEASMRGALVRRDTNSYWSLCQLRETICH